MHEKQCFPVDIKLLSLLLHNHNICIFDGVVVTCISLFQFIMSSDESRAEIYFTTTQDIKGKIQPRFNEEGVLEYDLDKVLSSSRPSSMPVEYVLSNSIQESNQHENQAEVQHFRLERPIIQDEYDEELYCLARSDEDSKAPVRSDENNKTKDADAWLTKRNIIICVLILLFVMGGVAIYFGSISSGICIESLIV